MNLIAQELQKIVEESYQRLIEIDPEEARRRTDPRRWSPKEIIGHLIDSASNNHQRFVRAQFQDHLVFLGYNQDHWVEAQRYIDEPWTILLDLWRNFNLHLAHVIAVTPEKISSESRKKHNLHQIAWLTVPEEEPASLEYFMLDYVNHVKHHLNQIPQLQPNL